MDPITFNKMKALAIEMKDKSHSPYSKFRVGCSLLTKSGKIFTGCNVENAAFGECICGERTAVVKAVSEGYTDFVACVVSVDVDIVKGPCGSCRQVFREFCGPEFEFVSLTCDNEENRFLLKELLPHSFGPEFLKK